MNSRSDTPRSNRLNAPIACIITLLAVSTVFMTQSIFFEISETFLIDLGHARFSFSIVSLFYAGSFFFLGPVADNFNLPKMAATGLVMLAIFVLLAANTHNFSLFIMTMALMGICAAFIPAAMFPHMALTAPEEKKGVYMGSIVASATLGVVFGRAFMGLMTAGIGWQASFKMVSLLLLLTAVICIFTLIRKETQSPNNEKIFTLYARSMKLILSPKTLSFLAAGFFLFFGFMGMVTFLTYRLIGPPFNFSAQQVGWISFAGISALVAPFSGALSQRIGRFKIILPGVVICLLAAQFMGWSPSIILTCLGVLLLFFGVYACQPLVFLLIGDNIPQKSLGSASSLYILFCIGGTSVSSMVLGPVWVTHGWSGITITCSLALLMALLILSILAAKR